MGNCQAIDNASLVIQHHHSGRVERLYAPISAAEVMKLNPGHHVALLLTTTLYSSRPSTSSSSSSTTTVVNKPNNQSNKNSVLVGGATITNGPQPLRITRIKLLRPTDTLALGHVYRLVTTQEVMKGLMAKKKGKMGSVSTKIQPESSAGNIEVAPTKSHPSEKTHHHQQMKKPDKHRPRTGAPANSSTAATVAKPRGWHPSLMSISEATS